MSRGARVALVVVLALCGAALGAIGATVLHWNVVQPSDDDLRSAARGVSLSGFTTRDSMAVSGAWAPSFDRGVVHWDAVTDRAVTVDDLAAELRAEGWTVDAGQDPDGSGTLHGVRQPYYLGITLLPAKDVGATVSVVVGRGQITPSLATSMRLGIAAGGAIGACVGVVLVRRYGRSHPRQP